MSSRRTYARRVLATVHDGNEGVDLIENRQRRKTTAPQHHHQDHQDDAGDAPEDASRSVNKRVFALASERTLLNDAAGLSALDGSLEMRSSFEDLDSKFESIESVMSAGTSRSTADTGGATVTRKRRRPTSIGSSSMERANSDFFSLFTERAGHAKPESPALKRSRSAGQATGSSIAAAAETPTTTSGTQSVSCSLEVDPFSFDAPTGLFGRNVRIGSEKRHRGDGSAMSQDSSLRRLARSTSSSTRVLHTFQDPSDDPWGRGRSRRSQGSGSESDDSSWSDSYQDQGSSAEEGTADSPASPSRKLASDARTHSRVLRSIEHATTKELLKPSSDPRGKSGDTRMREMRLQLEACISQFFKQEPPDESDSTSGLLDFCALCRSDSALLGVCLRLFGDFGGSDRAFWVKLSDFVKSDYGSDLQATILAASLSLYLNDSANRLSVATCVDGRLPLVDSVVSLFLSRNEGTGASTASRVRSDSKPSGSQKKAFRLELHRSSSAVEKSLDRTLTDLSKLIDFSPPRSYDELSTSMFEVEVRNVCVLSCLNSLLQETNDGTQTYIRRLLRSAQQLERVRGIALEFTRIIDSLVDSRNHDDLRDAVCLFPPLCDTLRILELCSDRVLDSAIVSEFCSISSRLTHVVGHWRSCSLDDCPVCLSTTRERDCSHFARFLCTLAHNNLDFNGSLFEVVSSVDVAHWLLAAVRDVEAKLASRSEFTYAFDTAVFVACFVVNVCETTTVNCSTFSSMRVPSFVQDTVSLWERLTRFSERSASESTTAGRVARVLASYLALLLTTLSCFSRSRTVVASALRTIPDSDVPNGHRDALCVCDLRGMVSDFLLFQASAGTLTKEAQEAMQRALDATDCVPRS